MKNKIAQDVRAPRTVVRQLEELRLTTSRGSRAWHLRIAKL